MSGSNEARVFFDIDTQVDFLDPSGALYVPGAEAIVERVAALNHFAAAHRIPLISTMDAHAVNDPEFRDWPPHCIAGTPGQRKPASTLLKRSVVVANSPGLPNLARAPQVLLEKQTFDCFTNAETGGAARAAACGRVRGLRRRYRNLREVRGARAAANRPESVDRHRRGQGA